MTDLDPFDVRKLDVATRAQYLHEKYQGGLTPTAALTLAESGGSLRALDEAATSATSVGQIVNEVERLQSLPEAAQRDAVLNMSLDYKALLEGYGYRSPDLIDDQRSREQSAWDRITKPIGDVVGFGAEATQNALEMPMKVGSKGLDMLWTVSEPFAGGIFRGLRERDPEEVMAREMMRLNRARASLASDGVEMTDREFMQTARWYAERAQVEADRHSQNAFMGPLGWLNNALTEEVDVLFGEDGNPLRTAAAKQTLVDFIDERYGEQLGGPLPDQSVLMKFEAAATNLERDKDFDRSLRAAWDRVNANHGTDYHLPSRLLDAQDQLGGYDSEQFQFISYAANHSEMDPGAAAAQFLVDVIGLDPNDQSIGTRAALMVQDYLPDGSIGRDVYDQLRDADNRVSAGRWAAEELGMSRGSTPWSITSGILDAGHVMVNDPLNVIGPIGKGAGGIKRGFRGARSLLQGRYVASVLDDLAAEGIEVVGRRTLYDEVARRSAITLDEVDEPVRGLLTGEVPALAQRLTARGVPTSIVDDTGAILPSGPHLEEYTRALDQLYYDEALPAYRAGSSEAGELIDQIDEVKLILGQNLTAADYPGVKGAFDRLYVRGLQDTNRTFDHIAAAFRAADAGDDAPLMRLFHKEMPQLQNAADSLMAHHRLLQSVRDGQGIQSATDIWRFFEAEEGLKALMSGALERGGRRYGPRLLPQYNKRHRAWRSVSNTVEKAAWEMSNWGKRWGMKDGSVPLWHRMMTSPFRVVPNAIGSTITGMTHRRPNTVLKIMGHDSFVEQARFADAFAIAANQSMEVADEYKKKWIRASLNGTADSLDDLTDEALEEVMARRGEDVITRIDLTGQYLRMIFNEAIPNPTDEQREWIARMADGFGRQVYSVDGNDLVRSIDGTEKRMPLWDVGQHSTQIALPDWEELMRQAQNLTQVEKGLGRLNNRSIDAFMSRIWKRSMLMRLGFPLRAGGEEGFAFLATFGFRAPQAMAARLAIRDKRGLAARAASTLLGQTGWRRTDFYRFLQEGGWDDLVEAANAADRADYVQRTIARSILGHRAEDIDELPDQIKKARELYDDLRRPNLDDPFDWGMSHDDALEIVADQVVRRRDSLALSAEFITARLNARARKLWLKVASNEMAAAAYALDAHAMLDRLGMADEVKRKVARSNAFRGREDVIRNIARYDPQIVRTQSEVLNHADHGIADLEEIYGPMEAMYVLDDAFGYGSGEAIELRFRKGSHTVFKTQDEQRFDRLLYPYQVLNNDPAAQAAARVLVDWFPKSQQDAVLPLFRGTRWDRSLWERAETVADNLAPDIVSVNENRTVAVNLHQLRGDMELDNLWLRGRSNAPESQALADGAAILDVDLEQLTRYLMTSDRTEDEAVAFVSGFYRRLMEREALTVDSEAERGRRAAAALDETLTDLGIGDEVARIAGGDTDVLRFLTVGILPESAPSRLEFITDLSNNVEIAGDEVLPILRHLYPDDDDAHLISTALDYATSLGYLRWTVDGPHIKPMHQLDFVEWLREYRYGVAPGRRQTRAATIGLPSDEWHVNNPRPKGAPFTEPAPPPLTGTADEAAAPVTPDVPAQAVTGDRTPGEHPWGIEFHDGRDTDVWFNRLKNNEVAGGLVDPSVTGRWKPGDVIVVRDNANPGRPTVRVVIDRIVSVAQGDDNPAFRRVTGLRKDQWQRAVNRKDWDLVEWHLEGVDTAAVRKTKATAARAELDATRPPKIVVVTGSRKWQPSKAELARMGVDEQTDALSLDRLLRERARAMLKESWEGGDGPAPIMLHGDARGADKILAEEADKLGWDVRPYDAQWERGRAGLEDRPEKEFTERLNRKGEREVIWNRAGEARNRRLLDEAERLQKHFGSPIEGWAFSANRGGYDGGTGQMLSLMEAKARQYRDMRVKSWDLSMLTDLKQFRGEMLQTADVVPGIEYVRVADPATALPRRAQARIQIGGSNHFAAAFEGTDPDDAVAVFATMSAVPDEQLAGELAPHLGQGHLFYVYDRVDQQPLIDALTDNGESVVVVGRSERPRTTFDVVPMVDDPLGEWRGLPDGDALGRLSDEREGQFFPYESMEPEERAAVMERHAGYTDDEVHQMDVTVADTPVGDLAWVFDRSMRESALERRYGGLNGDGIDITSTISETIAPVDEAVRKLFPGDLNAKGGTLPMNRVLDMLASGATPEQQAGEAGLYDALRKVRQKAGSVPKEKEDLLTRTRAHRRKARSTRGQVANEAAQEGEVTADRPLRQAADDRASWRAQEQRVDPDGEFARLQEERRQASPAVQRWEAMRREHAKVTQSADGSYKANGPHMGLVANAAELGKIDVAVAWSLGDEWNMAMVNRLIADVQGRYNVHGDELLDIVAPARWDDIGSIHQLVPNHRRLTAVLDDWIDETQEKVVRLYGALGDEGARGGGKEGRLLDRLVRTRDELNEYADIRRAQAEHDARIFDAASATTVEEGVGPDVLDYVGIPADMRLLHLDLDLGEANLARLEAVTDDLDPRNWSIPEIKRILDETGFGGHWRTTMLEMAEIEAKAEAKRVADAVSNMAHELLSFYTTKAKGRDLLVRRGGEAIESEEATAILDALIRGKRPRKRAAETAMLRGEAPTPAQLEYRARQSGGLPTEEPPATFVDDESRMADEILTDDEEDAAAALLDESEAPAAVVPDEGLDTEGLRGWWQDIRREAREAQREIDAPVEEGGYAALDQHPIWSSQVYLPPAKELSEEGRAFAERFGGLRKARQIPHPLYNDRKLFTTKRFATEGGPATQSFEDAIAHGDLDEIVDLIMRDRTTSKGRKAVGQGRTGGQRLTSDELDAFGLAGPENADLADRLNDFLGQADADLFADDEAMQRLARLRADLGGEQAPPAGVAEEAPRPTPDEIDQALVDAGADEGAVAASRPSQGSDFLESGEEFTPPDVPGYQTPPTATGGAVPPQGPPPPPTVSGSEMPDVPEPRFDANRQATEHLQGMTVPQLRRMVRALGGRQSRQGKRYSKPQLIDEVLTHWGAPSPTRARAPKVTPAKMPTGRQQGLHVMQNFVDAVKQYSEGANGRVGEWLRSWAKMPASADDVEFTLVAHKKGQVPLVEYAHKRFGDLEEIDERLLDVLQHAVTIQSEELIDVVAQLHTLGQHGNHMTTMLTHADTLFDDPDIALRLRQAINDEYASNELLAAMAIDQERTYRAADGQVDATKAITGPTETWFLPLFNQDTANALVMLGRAGREVDLMDDLRRAGISKPEQVMVLEMMERLAYPSTGPNVVGGEDIVNGAFAAVTDPSPNILRAIDPLAHGDRKAMDDLTEALSRSKTLREFLVVSQEPRVRTGYTQVQGLGGSSEFTETALSGRVTRGRGPGATEGGIPPWAARSLGQGSPGARPHVLLSDPDRIRALEASTTNWVDLGEEVAEGRRWAQGNPIGAAQQSKVQTQATEIEKMLVPDGAPLYELAAPISQGRLSKHQMSHMDTTRLPKQLYAPEVSASVKAGPWDRLSSWSFKHMSQLMDSMSRQPRYLAEYTEALIDTAPLYDRLMDPRITALADQSIARWRTAINGANLAGDEAALWRQVKDGDLTEDLRDLWAMMDGWQQQTAIDDPTFLRRVANDTGPAIDTGKADEHYLGRLLRHMDTDDLRTTVRYLQADHVANMKVHQVASRRAATNVTPFIDDHNVKSLWASQARNVVPFFFATEQFFKRWARTAVADPRSIRRAQLMGHAFMAGTWIEQDENGNKVFTIPMSEALTTVLGNMPTKYLFGAEAGAPIQVPLVGRTDHMLPGIPGDFERLPAVGPFAQFAAGALATQFPELRDPYSRMFDQQPTLDPTGSLLPTWLRRTWKGMVWSDDHDQELASSMLGSIQMMEAEAIRLNQVGDELMEAGKEDEALEKYQRAAQLRMPEGGDPAAIDAYLDEVRAWTRTTMFTRGLLGFALPAQPREDYDQAGLRQDFIDLLSVMDFEEALATFLTEHPDGGPWTIMETRAVSGAPLPPTDEAMAYLDENREYLDQFKLGGAWLLPMSRDASSMNRAAYAEFLARGMRYRRTPDEWVRQYKFAAGAGVYFDAQSVYQAEREQATDAGYKQYLDERWKLWSDAFRNTHPLFADELGKRRENERAQALSELRIIMNDPGRPSFEHEAETQMMLDELSIFEERLEMLRMADTVEADEERARSRRIFAEWGEDFVRRNPNMVPLWRTLIVPAAGIRQDVELPTGTAMLEAQR